jgi:serine/threonine protein phosphatase PrpC
MQPTPTRAPWTSSRRNDAVLCAVCDDRDEINACDAVERVRQAFDAGNDALSGVKGTMEAALFRAGHADIACSGEGRVYRVRNGRLETFEVTRQTITTCVGDVFVLCATDLRWVLGDQAIESIVASNAAPTRVADALVGAILGASGVTVLGHVVGTDHI